MVNLLPINQMRIAAFILAFVSISTIIAHCVIFIILNANLGTFDVPYAVLGQGLWAGTLAIGTATAMLSYATARSKESLTKLP